MMFEFLLLFISLMLLETWMIPVIFSHCTSYNLGNIFYIEKGFSGCLKFHCLNSKRNKMKQNKKLEPLAKRLDIYLK